MAVEMVNEVLMIPISEITPYDKNPRENSKTVELLAKIIPEVGFNVPLVLDENKVIVKGHARFLAAKKLGMDKVPCVISKASPEAIKADRIADNKVFEFTSWDDEELMHEVDMLALDFDPDMFGLPTVGSSDFDFVDDAVEEGGMSDEERKKRFEEMMEKAEAEAEAHPVQIVTQMEIDHAKQRQKLEAKRPPNYMEVTCEKCGRVFFVREGDATTWE